MEVTREDWKCLLIRRINDKGLYNPSPELYDDIPVEALKRLFFNMTNVETLCYRQITENNPDLEYKYFPILCNWIIEVYSETFQVTCKPLTKKSRFGFIHKTMRIVFNALSNEKNFLSSNLQLLGCTALYIALDDEKKSILTPKKLCWCTNNTYDVKQFNSMLNLTSKGNMFIITPLKSLDTLIIALRPNNFVRTMAQYLIDVIAHSILFINKHPLDIALSALIIAHVIENKDSNGYVKYAQFASVKNKTFIQFLTNTYRVYNILNVYETSGRINEVIICNNNLISKYYQTKFITFATVKKKSIKKTLF